MRRGFVVLVLGSLFLLVVGTLSGVHAVRFGGGERFVIEEGDIIPDDLYVAAQEVIIRGTVDGDVYAVAQRVVLERTGRVTGDLVAAAQVVDIQGVVEDDLRIAGQILRVAAPEVGDDIVGAGFSLELAEGAHVGGSLIVGGYQVLINGNVAEDVYVGANSVALYGTVGGNMTAEVGEGGGPSPALWTSFMAPPGMKVPTVPAGLTVGEGARVGGNLTYQSMEEATIVPGAQIEGKITHRLPPPSTKEEQPPQFGTLPWAVEQLRRWITLLVMGIILFLVMPAQARRVGTAIARKPLASLGWGVVVVAILIASLIGLIITGTLLAIIFGLLTLGQLAKWAIVLAFALDALLIIAYLGYVNLVAPVLVPYAVLSKLDRGTWWWLLPVVLGTFIYVVLTSLPYVGWLFSLVIVLASVGAFVVLYRARETPTGAPATVETTP